METRTSPVPNAGPTDWTSLKNTSGQKFRRLLSKRRASLAVRSLRGAVAGVAGPCIGQLVDRRGAGQRIEAGRDIRRHKVVNLAVYLVQAARSLDQAEAFLVEI